MPRLDPEWLTTFLAVAEHGGVLAASRALHLSQPALSARIQRLEDAVGHSLFDRTSQGMSLTDAGKRLLPVARKLPRVLSEAVEAVDPAAAARRAGPLRLSVSTTLADFVFPSLLTEFVREQGLPGMELRVGNTDEVLAAVRSGRVALGAVEGLSRAQGVRLEPFMDDELLPVYSPDKLPNEVLRELENATTAKAFAQLPLLWREPGSGTRRVIEAMFRKRGVSVSSLRIDYVLGGTMAVKGAALAGLGIAFLPRRTIGQELALGQLKEVWQPVLSLKRTFFWVLPTGELPAELDHFHRWINTRFKQ